MEDISGQNETHLNLSSRPDPKGLPFGLIIGALGLVGVLAFFLWPSGTGMFAYTPPEGWSLLRDRTRGMASMQDYTVGGVKSNAQISLCNLPKDSRFSSPEFLAKKFLGGTKPISIEPWVTMEGVTIKAFKNTHKLGKKPGVGLFHSFKRPEEPKLLVIYIRCPATTLSKLSDEFIDSLYSLEF